MTNIEKVEKLIEGNLKTKNTTLDLSKCNITGEEKILEKLQGANHILRLKLDNNIITNTLFLSDLKQIERLYLKNNKISDISFIENWKRLKHLDLSSNLIIDYSPIENLNKLQGLFLSFNHILDYSFIQNLTSVQSLSLFENKILDISFLSNLKILTYLNLGFNKISDISVLKELKQLQELDLSNNQITHISLDFINQIPNLKDLNLIGNPIQNIPKEIFDKEYENLLQVKEYLQLVEKQNELLNLINELEFSTFFNETKKIGKRNTELVRLEKKFMYDGGGFEFAEQLKVWVLHNFE